MNRNFRLKKADCTVSYLIGETPSIYGEPVKQIALTFQNGRTFIVPMDFLETIVEAADEESEIFLDGLKERLAVKKKEPEEQLLGAKVQPTDDGGFIFEQFKPKK